VKAVDQGKKTVLLETMNELCKIPIIQQALFFLQEAGSANGIKITETGALGRNFVQALWDTHLKTSDDDLIFRPTREFECIEATRIHFLLSENKYVRKFKGKICLTAKGKSTRESNSLSELYFDLLTTGIHGWSWGYEDRYPDYEFIQQSAEYLIEILLKSPWKTITAEKIFNEALSGKIKNLDQESKEELSRCLLVRFFYRFCIPFGILKGEDGDHFLNKKPHDPFEKTEFFISQFMKVLVEHSNHKNETQASRKNKSETTAGFTPAAQKFWDELEPKSRVRLINNAFCFSCKAETGIGNVSGSIERDSLILNGICTKCGEPVARLIGSDWIQ